jgi:hypothetical protein
MNVRAPVACVLVLTLLAAACGPARPAGAPGPAGSADDPAGTYRFFSEALDQRFEGEITLTRAADGSVGGSVSTPLAGALAVRSVTVRSQQMRIVAQGAEGRAALELEFAGSNFVGRWAYAGASAFLSGVQSSGPALAVRADLPAAGELDTEYAGRYTLTSGAATMQIDIRREDTHLVAQAHGQQSFPLLYLGNHRFRSHTSIGIEMQFNVEGSRPRSFTYYQGGRSAEALRTQ